MTETELRDSIRTSRQATESGPVFVRRILDLVVAVGDHRSSPGEIAAGIILLEPTRGHLRFRGLDVDQDDQP